MYEQYKMIAYFKVTFHNIHIRAKGAVEGVWYEFPYLVTKDDFLCFTAEWPPAWLEPGASTYIPKIPTKSCTGMQKNEKKTEE